MTKQELTGIYYDKFIDSVNSEATRKGYGTSIGLYLRYLNLEKPDDLLAVI